MIIFDKDNFEEEVLKAEGYVLVDFWSEGCVPCKALMPDVQRMSEEYEGKMKFGKLDSSKKTCNKRKGFRTSHNSDL